MPFAAAAQGLTSKNSYLILPDDRLEEAEMLAGGLHPA